MDSLSPIIPPIRSVADSGDTSGSFIIGTEGSLALANAVVTRVVAGHHDRPSRVSEIAVKIGAEIIEGQRKPGSDLNSVDLAREFQTSRTPIREALMLLERQGLIVVPPRRRPTVLIFELERIRELYNVRARLLELVAAYIAENATPAEIQELQQGVQDMIDAQRDIRSFFWSNVALHDRMTVIGRNVLAKTIIDSLLLRSLPLRRLSLSQPHRVAKSLDDHVRLLRAFQERDVLLATAIVRSNHRSALETIEHAMLSGPKAQPDGWT
ncbi:MAG TPA: GntR family transcriptional regulator [Xanthobacteraceae bacterium]|nr:GntR family transcriptional regulator [Xanthobacteraceae bacterium]